MNLRQQIALDEQNAKRILCRSSLSFSFTHTDTENTKTQTLTYKKNKKQIAYRFFNFFSISLLFLPFLSLLFDYSKHAPEIF